MADETKRVDVVMGPYRGNLLTMPAAEADAAISAHWARDPFSGEPYGTAHPPLSDEERAQAMTAAQAWAETQWATAGAGTEQKGGTKTRAMHAEDSNKYKTRGA